MASVAFAPVGKRVLVVDDSTSTRELLSTANRVATRDLLDLDRVRRTRIDALSPAWLERHRSMTCSDTRQTIAYTTVDGSEKIQIGSTPSKDSQRTKEWSLVNRRRLNAIAAFAVATVVVFSMMGGKAAAGWTPQLCDGVPKYYCDTVGYNNAGAYVDNISRTYQGALGGSGCPTYCTQKNWQIYWVQDWSCTSFPSGCTWQRNFGEGPTHDNCCLTGSAWYEIAGYTINQQAVINMKFRWFEKQLSYPYDPYTTCSQQQDHYLFNNTSAEIGSPSC
jgi:hypothetical protein